MSSVLTNYEHFLLTKINGPTISSIEGALRALSWLLPGRFKDADLASEALTSSLNLLSLYHHYLLTLLLRSNPSVKLTIPPSFLSRYTRAWADADSRYRWSMRLLGIIRSLELVIEMTLHRKVSNEIRWKGVWVLELIKAFLRLTIVRITRRPAIATPIPEHDIDPILVSQPSASPSAPSSFSSASSPTSSPALSASDATPAHLRNNRIAYEASKLLTPPSTPSLHPKRLHPEIDELEQFEAESQVQVRLDARPNIDSYLLSRALSPSSVTKSTSLMRTLSSPKDWISEVIYILRPLIYVILLKRQLDSKRSTASRISSLSPLIVSLALELLSRYTRRTPSASATLERSEYARRDRDIFWYIFRGEIWQDWTRPKLESIADLTASKPLVSIASGLIKAWVPLIDEYYYYTAT